MPPSFVFPERSTGPQKLHIHHPYIISIKTLRGDFLGPRFSSRQALQSAIYLILTIASSGPSTSWGHPSPFWACVTALTSHRTNWSGSRHDDSDMLMESAIASPRNDTACVLVIGFAKFCVRYLVSTFTTDDAPHTLRSLITVTASPCTSTVPNTSL